MFYLLPGNSAANKSRAASLKSRLKMIGGGVVAQDYQHRSDPAETIDIAGEAKQFLQAIKEHDIGLTTVICKSAGCLVFLQAAVDLVRSPERVLFFGYPVAFARKVGISLPPVDFGGLPVTVFQNSADPEGSAGQISALFGNYWEIKTVPGTTHTYSSEFVRMKTIELLG